jgi:hypothetical protein
MLDVMMYSVERERKESGDVFGLGTAGCVEVQWREGQVGKWRNL